MFRFCLLAIASLVAASGTASAQFYSYGGYHHSYSHSFPQQSYGNVGGYGHQGYGAVRQVQYLVPVTYRVPIFVQPKRVVQAPVIQHVQPACNTGCNCCQ